MKVPDLFKEAMWVLASLQTAAGQCNRLHHAENYFTEPWNDFALW